MTVKGVSLVVRERRGNLTIPTLVWRLKESLELLDPEALEVKLEILEETGCLASPEPLGPQ